MKTPSSGPRRRLVQPGGLGWAGFHLKSCPPSRSPTGCWDEVRSVRLRHFLLAVCLPPGVPEWVEMATGNHNKHLSKLIFNQRQARTYWMPVSVYRSRPSEDAVQQGLQSKCAGRGAWRGWKGSWGAIGSYVSNVLTRLRTACSLERPQWFLSLKFAPKSLRCHFDFTLTHGVTRCNACGCYTLLL